MYYSKLPHFLMLFLLLLFTTNALAQCLPQVPVSPDHR